MSILTDDNDDTPLPTLPSDSSVFRALLKKRCVHPDSNDVLPDAYIPRINGKDDDGLSVTITDANTESKLREEAKAFAESFNKTFGVALLNVGHVREVDDCLDVIRDPLDDIPNHALITGIPRQDQNPAKTERLAGQLARISQNIL